MNEKIIASFENEAVEKEKIKLLETLNIGPSQKASIILVALGLKPAAELDLYKHNDNEKIVKDVLVKAGFVLANKDIKENKNLVATIAVARDKETVDKLINADPGKDHEEYGRMMGFPESAIKAFINKEFFDEKDCLDTKDNIFPMKLSKDNWQKEVEVLDEWTEAIKKYSPKTYEEARRSD